MSVLPKPLRLYTGEPKLQGRPRKRPCGKNKAEQDCFANDSASTIVTVGPCNQLAQKPRTDQGRTLGKNPATERLVRLVQEFAKLVNEISS